MATPYIVDPSISINAFDDVLPNFNNITSNNQKNQLSLPMLFVFFMACMDPFPPSKAEESLSQTLAIWEQVSKNPQEKLELCGTISALENRDTCYMLAFEKIKFQDRSNAQSICNKMTQSAECFFQLGEVYDSVEYCQKSTAFEKDCRFHLLSRKLFSQQVQDYQSAVQWAEHYGIDMQSIEGKTIVYRHLISQQQPLSTDICSDLPHTHDCIRAAQSIYLDRLRYHHNITHQFDCNTPFNSDLSFSKDPHLEKILAEFTQEVCP